MRHITPKIIPLTLILPMLLSEAVCIAQKSQIEQQKVIRIPVIFHVIYSKRVHNGRTDGGNISENLDTALLFSELRDLERDFMLLNRDTSQVLALFKTIIGKPNIQFTLADTILQPGGERGVIRVYNNRNGKDLHLRSPIIDHNRYLNIYIGDIGNFTPTNPWQYSNKDAVFISYAWVGLGYRLLTHEVGHWLGLFHPWGTANGHGDRNSCKSGDGISDTPPQYEATEPSGQCVICPIPSSRNDKTCDPTKKLPSNFNNFMDYSGCRRMFTVEQVIYMRNTIQEHRKFLWNNSH